jgi:hypothetical protein
MPHALYYRLTLERYDDVTQESDFEHYHHCPITTRN